MKRIDLTKLVKVCAGEMGLDTVVDKRLNTVVYEIKHHMLKSPKKMVITIERGSEAERYYTTIYLSKENFYKK